MKVLICGLNGAGVETAKNLILAGPNTVALHDPTISRIQDLASNFYLTEQDVQQGVSRAEACVKRLSELNDYVSTTIIEGELSPEVLHQFDVVVVSDMKMSEMIRINRICRSHEPSIGFVAMDGFGLCASVFVDFGDEFAVFDRNGEQPQSSIIEGITQDYPATVHLHQDKRNPFELGDFVQFREIQGMSELNNRMAVKILSSGRYSISIDCDTKELPAYLRDGVVEQVKVPSKIQFRSLELCLERPVASDEDSLLVPDLAKFGRSEQLHFGIQAVYAYREKHGFLPPPRNSAAVEECLATANHLNEQAKKSSEETNEGVNWKSAPVDSIDRAIIENIVYYASCHISPIAAFLGGVVAQEVVKFTGKFTPLHQWLYFDAFECLLKTPPVDTEPLNSRYDHQIAIWGKNFQERLGKIRMFVVGAGALGCEYLKSFALMGCSTRESHLTVTDMDRIEVSNLNRQFLFRRHHVGTPKSRTAAEAAATMNPSLRVISSEARVGPETEEEFNDSFWEGLDFVVNALDNVQSRLYIDGRCVWYRKPLLESGTLGTKANSQVVIPCMTQSYGDSQDPPEDSIPLCTLRHFPNQIEHTIEWSRDLFQGLFCDGPQEASSFLNNVNGFLMRLCSEGTTATQRERLEKIHDLLATLKGGPTMAICVSKAVALFVNYFDHQIAQLLHTFPLDHLTSGGLPFWSGPKRPPQRLQFNPNDAMHLEFVAAAANLMAYNLGIQQERSKQRIREIAENVQIQAFRAKEIRIKVDEKDNTIEGAADDEIVKDKLQRELVQIAESLQKTGFAAQVAPVEFEKDDDTNFHIDFISACANLRARNYR
ncbi:ubiquitin-like modifier-activating enzyme 1, partial [Condylostylus longicornis]|uniref:ubiquitin-like modifier-activating enzyme 1 n=1 Tax=Condylostylus longicornis TaxID=2530218 RepID=UPI00244DBFFC